MLSKNDLLQRGIESLQKQGYQYIRRHECFAFRQTYAQPGELLSQDEIYINRRAPHTVTKETFRNGFRKIASFSMEEIQAVADICNSFSDTAITSKKEDQNAKH